MLENRDDLLSIVVLEAGAAWPAWLTEYQRLAPNAVVIAEARAEAAVQFEARVVHRVEEATAHSGPRVRVGVMVLADPADREREAGRKNIAWALLKAMGAAHEAELVLAGDGQESDGSRHELFALAGTLCEELGGTHVNVRVRFTHGKSGVMRAITPSSPDVEAVSSKSHS
jgi:hypothetical protein